MTTLYTLKAGHTLSVSVNEGRAHVSSGSMGGFTRSSAAFGPFLVETEWLVDGDATVTMAEYTVALNAYVYPNAGAPADAVRATLSLNPTGDDNALTATARVYGTEGNSITIAYVDPEANDAALSVSVFRQAITVSLATDSGGSITSTAAEVLAAIEAHDEAAALVTMAINAADSGSGDDGSGIVTALSAAALAGGAGTGIGIVGKGGLVVDTTNGRAYVNTGTLAAPAWSGVASGASVPVTMDIDLAASETTDGMDITVTVRDARGDAIAGVFEFEWWISEAATGIGLTADSYSGDVTAVTGTEWIEIVSKKHYRALTAATGIFSATAVASANPTDQYVAVRHPATGQIIVSAASGTNWEGAA